MRAALTQDAGPRVNKYSIQGSLHVVITKEDVNQLVNKVISSSDRFKKRTPVQEAVSAGFGCTSYGAMHYRIKNGLSVQAFNKDNFYNRLAEFYGHPIVKVFSATFDFDINALLAND